MQTNVHGSRCTAWGITLAITEFQDALDTLFNLKPAYPAINFEPYYTGWDHALNKPNGERPPANSVRDNYFTRADVWISPFRRTIGTCTWDCSIRHNYNR